MVVADDIFTPPSPLPAGFSGRCRSHVYPFSRQKVTSSPGSCPSQPAAITAGWHATVVRHTIGRCQNRWRSHTLRDSSKRSLTGSTQSRGSLPWALRGRHRALSGRHLSTPWPSNRSPVTTASTLVSSSFQNIAGASVPRRSTLCFGIMEAGR